VISMDANTSAIPLYALIDQRYDKRPRIVAEYTDPHAACSAADLLRYSGSTVEVVLISAIKGDYSPSPLANAHE
jgi:hypothetical protein